MTDDDRPNDAPPLSDAEPVAPTPALPSPATAAAAAAAATAERAAAAGLSVVPAGASLSPAADADAEEEAETEAEDEEPAALASRPLRLLAVMASAAARRTRACRMSPVRVSAARLRCAGGCKDPEDNKRGVDEG